MRANPSILELIQRGEIVSYELSPVGSNYTFLVQLRLGERTGKAIYKPRDGEATLWDFGGEPIPESLLVSLTKLSQQLVRPEGRLGELLDLLLPQEALALHQRLNWVLKERVYPGVPGMRSRR